MLRKYVIQWSLEGESVILAKDEQDAQQKFENDPTNFEIWNTAKNVKLTDSSRLEIDEIYAMRGLAWAKSA